MIGGPARPEVVFFDVGDTLVRPEPSWADVYHAACHAWGLDIPRDEIARGLSHAIAAGGLDEVGPFEATPEASFERIRHFDELIMAAVGHPDLPAAFYRVVGATFADRERWHVYPEVPAALERLAAASVRTAVISNWLWEAPALLKQLGLGRHFETLVISDRVGYNKPHPAIFAEGLHRMGVAPAAAVHVGDSYRNDVGGARRAGIAPVLMDRSAPRGSRPAGVPVGDDVPVVHDLDELLAFLGI